MSQLRKASQLDFFKFSTKYKPQKKKTQGPYKMNDYGDD